MLMDIAGSRSCGGRALQDDGLDEECMQCNKPSRLLKSDNIINFKQAFDRKQQQS